MIEAPVGDGEPLFRPFWAHDRAGEKQAMVDFMTYLLARRAAHLGMHVYHYAPYERFALLRLAGRHGVEDELHELLRAAVLVDLYATVRASLRTGERAYSLKNVEHVYGMAHVGDVKKADQSIVEYANACELRDAGDLAGWQAKLDQIGDYNRTDCISTLRLRDWLLARGAELGVSPEPAAAAGEEAAGPDEESDEGFVVDPLDVPLMAFADLPDAPPGPRTPERQAAAMLAAALGYHWREAKPFWWAHYDRLSADPAAWTDKRSTLVADEVAVVRDWHVPERAHKQKRVLQLVGRLEPDSDLRPGTTVYPLYDPPVPDNAKTTERGLRGWRPGTTTVTAVGARGDDERDVVTVEEGGVPKDGVGHDELPMGLAPNPGGSRASRRVAGHLPGVAARPRGGVRPVRHRASPLAAVRDPCHHRCRPADRPRLGRRGGLTLDRDRAARVLPLATSDLAGRGRHEPAPGLSDGGVR